MHEDLAVLEARSILSEMKFLRRMSSIPQSTDSDVIMAAGAFVQGSSIELSADGPIRDPYAVYFQGGLTWYHAKLGILMSLQKLVGAGLVTL